MPDEEDSLTLPKSVSTKSCFQQMLGCWSIRESFMHEAMDRVGQIGLPAIWKANEAKGDYPDFSPKIFEIAEQFRAAGVSFEVPKAGDDSDYDDSDVGDNRCPPPYVNVGGTAIIPVSGPLSKQPSSLSHMFGGSSTVGMRKALAMANQDSRVQRIMWHIDSPGGTVSGTGDLGLDISDSAKPTFSYIEDAGFSAAYWLASQTEKIFASQYAETGSIGAIMVVHDTSKMFQDAGIKVNVIKSGPYKGGPIRGTPVTDAQKQKLQAEVDHWHGTFVSVVASGRGMSESAVSKLADGSIYPATKAVELGLVDKVSTFAEALRSISTTNPEVRRKKKPAMPTYQSNASCGDITVANTTGLSTEVTTSGAKTDTSIVTGAEIPADVITQKNTNTPETSVLAGNPPMADPPTTDPKTPEKGATVSITAEDLAVLRAGAEAGVRAEKKLVADESARLARDAQVLKDERELAVANHGLTAEQVAACPDLNSLRAMVAVKQEGKTNRAAADPKKPVVENVEAVAHFKALDEGRTAFVHEAAIRRA